MFSLRNISRSLGVLLSAVWVVSLSVYAEEEPLPVYEPSPQWRDFGDRVIEFSGYRWRVKTAKHRMGPGNNWFSDSEKNVWVDEEGRLHLRTTYKDGYWYCAEVALEEPLGYGDYIFKTVGRVDKLDRSVVLGLFIWEYKDSPSGHRKNDPHNNNIYNEFDIEFSNWNRRSKYPAQFTSQPADDDENIYRFDMKLKSNDARTSHAFLWHPSGIACRSWRGHRDVPSTNQVIANWFYAGSDMPRNEAPRVHINLWCNSKPSSKKKEQEVIISEFKFVGTP